MEERPFVDSLIGLRIGGRYVVEKVLGAGGMGVVVTARYPELEQKVAIKFLLPQHAANGVLNARFVREARLAAKVKSEHFVRVFDIGKLPSGIPYLVMELLAGKDLGEELAACGPLPVEQAVDHVLQAAVGVAEIHALGVVHRDLKPSNLFVSQAAGKRTIKVLDFGISKESGSDSGAPLTATDNLLGTPQYMSPEQVRASKDVDARSDIWSMGVILYELLTMHRPFVSEENAVGELFAQVLYIDPKPPRDHRPEMPEALEAVILKCLARDRGQRFANVGELAEALRPFASAASAHRIEAVFQALTTRRSIAPPRVEGESEPAAVSQLPTAESSPVAKRDAIALAPTAESSPDARRAAVEAQSALPVTAMTSSTGSRSREGEGRVGGRWIGLGIGVAAIAVGAFAFALASRPTASVDAPLPPAPSGVALPLTSSAAGASAVLAPVETSLPTGAASSASSPPNAVAPAVTPKPSAHAPRIAPQPRPSARASSAPVSSGGPKPSGTGDLIQDRK